MKKSIATALATVTCAIKISDTSDYSLAPTMLSYAQTMLELSPENIANKRVQDAGQCRDLKLKKKKRKKMHYEFNEEACACFIVWDKDPGYDCSDQEINTYVNPFSRNASKESYCISEAEYNLIFEHTLGPDCIEGTEDDTGGDDGEEPTGGDDGQEPTGGDDGEEPTGDDDGEPTGGDDGEEPTGDDNGEPTGGDDGEEPTGGDDGEEPTGDDGGEPTGGDDGEEPTGDDDGEPTGGDDGEEPTGDDDGEEPTGGDNGEEPTGGDDGEEPTGGDDGEEPSGGDDGEEPTGGDDGEEPTGGDDGEEPTGDDDGEPTGGDSNGEETNGGENSTDNNTGIDTGGIDYELFGDQPVTINSTTTTIIVIQNCDCNSEDNQAIEDSALIGMDTDLSSLVDDLTINTEHVVVQVMQGTCDCE